MTCEGCDRALPNPRLAVLYINGCKSCDARRLAVSPMGKRALDGEPAELQAAIEAVWKDEVDVGRKLVWEWMQKLKPKEGA